MNINWNIAFQIINFLVLVFLLRKFLYGPIIKTMDEREQLILQREEEARAKGEEAETTARDYREKAASLQEREEAILQQAAAEMEDERRRLLEAARREVGETRQRWEEAFFQEKESFVQQLRLQMGQQASRIARSCLNDLADLSLEQAVWGVFLNKVQKLDEIEQQKLANALAAGGRSAQLRSSFPAPEDKLQQLSSLLADLRIGSTDGTSVHLNAQIDPALICGIELEIAGYRLAWSVESYLQGVEEQIVRALDREQQKLKDLKKTIGISEEQLSEEDAGRGGTGA